MSNMYMYDVGEFRRIIQVQVYEEKTVDGRPVKGELKTILTTRAKTFKDNKTTTSEGKQGDTDKVSKRILIRTPRSIEITNDMQVLFKGKSYKIKSSNDIKELNTYTEILLERLE